MSIRKTTSTSECGDTCREELLRILNEYIRYDEQDGRGFTYATMDFAKLMGVELKEDK